MSEDNEIEDYDSLRKQIKDLEAQVAKRAWGSSSGGGGVSFAAGDEQAEVESIHAALKAETLTRAQEKRLREIRLAPLWDRVTNDILNG